MRYEALFSDESPGGEAVAGDPVLGKPPGRLGSEWSPVGEWWNEVTDPKPREYLLFDERDGPRKGVFPAGRVAMLAAGGGVGKSFAALDLAVSIATGRAWLRPMPSSNEPAAFVPGRTGKVLALFGEEERPELARRLSAILGDGPDGVTAHQEALLKERLHLVPLAGVQVGCTDRDGRVTDEGAELLRRARELAPLALIVVDPLSRFSGPAAETDNALATRFVTFLEQLSEAGGGPDERAAVLVVHHHSQSGRQRGDTTDTAARGVSALVDGVRWVANMHRVAIGADNNGETRDYSSLYVSLSVAKSSYCATPEPVYLFRGPSGQLRQIPKETARKETMGSGAVGAGAAAAATSQKGAAEHALRAFIGEARSRLTSDTAKDVKKHLATDLMRKLSGKPELSGVYLCTELLVELNEVVSKDTVETLKKLSKQAAGNP